MIRRLPPPLSVTRPPPSSTTGVVRLCTLAVADIVIVTGAGPQLKVMMPPAATAFTTAEEVQLAAVPLPIVRVGWLVSTARAALGIEACPAGLPGLGRSLGATGLDGAGVALTLGDAEVDGATDPSGNSAESDKTGAAAAACGSSW